MKLSKIKKDLRTAPHLWVIFRSGRRYMISIGDPKNVKSRVIRSFPDKEELKYWVKYTMSEEVSPNHILDLTGLKLVPKYYTQWYVNNILQP